MATFNPGLDYEASEDPLWHPALRALPVPGIRRMVNLASELEDVVHLSLGQPDFATPEHIIEEHVRALRAGQTGYTLDAGLPELLTAIRDHYSERYQRPLTEDNILVTTGATEAMYLALAATAAPGRQFILPEPTFPLYAPLIRMNGGEVKPIPTHAENGHQLDPQQVIDAIGERTFAIVLNSPSNPTGTVYPASTVEAIIQEAAYRGVKVLSDEVYDRILLDEDEPYASVLRCTADLDHVMVISSFSKTFSMPGLRVGWLISSQGVIRMLRRYHIFTTTVANTPAQWAGVAALRGPTDFLTDMLAEYRRRRDRVVELVNETPWLRGYRPNGAFYIFPQLPARAHGTDLAMRLLRDTGVCVVPGDTFGDHCDNAWRISYATSMEQIEEAFARLQPWLARQSF